MQEVLNIQHLLHLLAFRTYNLATPTTLNMSLTHLNDAGEAHMVDVGAKAETHRVAEAEARVSMAREAFAALVIFM